MKRRCINRKASGRTITEKGYVRLTAGPYRNWYEHRLKMAQMCSEFCYYQAPGIVKVPEGFVVHHMNFNKQHNCHCNLLLLQAVLHNNSIGIPTDKLPWQEGKRPWEEEPDWVAASEGGEEDVTQSWEADR